MKPTVIKQKVTLEAIGALIERSIAFLPTREEMKKEINLATSKLATKDEMNKSIDDLAGAVKKGFDEVHEKFAKIDEKFIKVDERFDVLERKVDRMNDSFTNQLDYLNLYCLTRKEFTELDDRMKKVEKKLKV
jgi:uncharacterized protein YqgV (UPF0045/DUF77 family)